MTIRYDEAVNDRLDPRVRALAPSWPLDPPSDVASREEILAEVASSSGRSAVAAEAAFMDRGGREAIVPAGPFSVTERDITSTPDGNRIRVQVIRPPGSESLACVYFIHGGAMSTLSCFLESYQAWARILSAHGVCVVMVDFRNAVVASSVPEVAPFPAGLHDCLAGLEWTHDHADEFGIDPARIVVAGESGGGNLTIATGLALKRDGRLDMVKGLYALCPYIAGRWPDDRFPSSSAYNGLMLELHTNRGAMAYGIEAYRERNPLAWPGFATVDDVRGFPPTVVSVNECDPLRDEGIAFYRLLCDAGVPARGRVVLGTGHATELYPALCPEITNDTARDLAAFARD